MTNKELLHASLLDILFDGRNKNYGAYVLRRDYNRRLLLALGLGLSAVFIFLFLQGLIKNAESSMPAAPDSKVELTIMQLPDDPQPQAQPEKPQPKPKAPESPKQEAAEVKNTTINIVKDYLVPITEVPDVSLLAEYKSGLDDKEGVINDKVVRSPSIPVSGNGNGQTEVINETIKPSSPPEFPGGFEALRKFLYRHLATPDQLGMMAGEKTMVKARFVVGQDGTVSVIEVIESGGTAFDREVMRVVKKMPKWKPAIQNGKPVSASYVLPVTFIGEEQ